MKRKIALTVIALAAMAFSQVYNDIVVRELFRPVARTQTVGTYGSDAVDCKSFHSAVAVLYSEASTAGSGTSFATVIQESDPLVVGTKENRTATTVVSKVLRGDSTRLMIDCKFTQSGARQLYKAYFWLKRAGTIASSKYVILRLETNNAGAPSGTLVHADATDSVSATSMDTTFKFIEFTFQRPIDVANSSIYHLVLTGDYALSTSNYIAVGSEVVASGGDFARRDSSGWQTLATDTSVLAFSEQYYFTDISGAIMDTVTETARVYDTYNINLRGKKRFIRLKSTVAGTSASFVGSAVLVLGEPTYKPAQ